MKLNPDCVRDILIAVEENTGYRETLAISRSDGYADQMPVCLKEYPIDEVLYHIRQCEMAGLIVLGLSVLRVEFNIADLTPQGHEFLANVREKTIWNGVKAVSKKVGSTSLSALVQIASNVISQLIKNQFHLA